MKDNGVASPSVSRGAARLVDALLVDSAALRCGVTKGAAGETQIDLGAKVPGGLEAGRRLAEICMGGLGHVAITSGSGLARWPFAVCVHTANPVIACLASQYGGWTLRDDDSGYAALGSGPARALARKETLYVELGYRDQAEHAILVIEGQAPPPPGLAERIAADCQVSPRNLTVLYAPTGSLAGTVQIAARCLEVALHKAHTLGFPLVSIVDGLGVAPLSPPVGDFAEAMGRTNDAIIYGGRVQLHVRGSDSAARKLAEDLPSSRSPAYGRPFAEIFAAAGGDFYKIDPLLFSPAVATVTSLETGASFHAGALAPDIIDASFA